jgi:glutamyl-Q tRNA(Asp) synthetase
MPEANSLSEASLGILMSVVTRIGRFAPSPTGPLHFGSLVSAVASFLDSKQYAGQWLLRMEDIDPPREMPGAASQILAQLEAHGLLWDKTVLYQSDRQDSYIEALNQLKNKGLVYSCQCNRQRIVRLGGVYDRQCRDLQLQDDNATLRLCLDDNTGTQWFDDQIMGRFEQHLNGEVGDFTVRRRDGLFSYQLAVVVDDEFQGITHIMRGSDLLDSTPRQIFLQQCLGYRKPEYAHLPVALNQDRQKLSKQHHAAALVAGRESVNLWMALAWLQQRPPPALQRLDVSEILNWARSHWQPQAIYPSMPASAPEGY